MYEAPNVQDLHMQGPKKEEKSVACHEDVVQSEEIAVQNKPPPRQGLGRGRRGQGVETVWVQIRYKRDIGRALHRSRRPYVAIDTEKRQTHPLPRGVWQIAPCTITMKI